jgi:hypothetical protein
MQLHRSAAATTSAAGPRRRSRCGGKAAQRRVLAAAQPPTGDAGAWWDSLSKGSVKGPAPPAVDPEPMTVEGWNELRMGVKGYREFETIKREERQRGARGDGARSRLGAAWKRRRCGSQVPGLTAAMPWRRVQRPRPTARRRRACNGGSAAPGRPPPPPSTSITPCAPRPPPPCPPRSLGCDAAHRAGAPCARRDAVVVQAGVA